MSVLFSDAYASLLPLRPLFRHPAPLAVLVHGGGHSQHGCALMLCAHCLPDMYSCTLRHWPPSLSPLQSSHHTSSAPRSPFFFFLFRLNPVLCPRRPTPMPKARTARDFTFIIGRLKSHHLSLCSLSAGVPLGQGPGAMETLSVGHRAVEHRLV